MKRKDLFHFIAFACSELGIEYSMVVRQVKGKKHLGKKEGYDGYHIWDNDNLYSDIYYDKGLSYREKLETIAHELTHARQYYNFELRDITYIESEDEIIFEIPVVEGMSYKNIDDIEENYGSYWKGKFVRHSANYHDMKHEDYKALPWEEEAERIGKQIAQKYLGK